MSRTIFAVKQQRITNYMWNDDDALSIYALRTGFPVLRDRFGFMNKFSNWNLYDKYIDFPSSSSTNKFSDLMDSRANDIVNKIRKEEKDLYIFLSGGVDSTAMTIAVIKTAGDNLKNIHVVYNDSTENEYPEFLSYLFQTNIDMYRCESYEIEDVQEKLLESNYTLTGWGADQLFGSAVSQNWPEWYNLDWKLWIKDTIGVNTDNAIGQLEDTFSYYNLPIKTFGELAWFMNFSTKYDIVTNSDALYSGKITHRMINFYDTQDFNDWSVSNFDILHKYPQQDTVHYKMALKDYIYDFNHDENYRNNKGKIRSWVRSGYHENEKYYPRAAILETPERIVFRKEPIRKILFDSIIISGKMTRNMLRFYRKKV